LRPRHRCLGGTAWCQDRRPWEWQAIEAPADVHCGSAAGSIVHRFDRASGDADREPAAPMPPRLINDYAIEEETALSLTHNVLIDQLLIPTLFVFFLIAGIAGAALGAALIVFRGRAFHMLGPMNRWVSARETLASLETVHNVDPTIYKYRRWFSAFFIVGAAFSMIMLLARFSVASVVAFLGANSSSIFARWLVESLGWMLFVGSALAMAIGVILGFFPRLLATLEAYANHWYSSRRAGRGVDQMFFTLDRWVESSPRTAGWIIATAALALAANSAVVLIGHR
jgi:hypothetical protein